MSIPDDADKNIGENLRRADDKVNHDEPGDAERREPPTGADDQDPPSK